MAQAGGRKPTKRDANAVFVVLDTNHFREVAEATGRAARFRWRAEAERADVFISIITVQEAASGWLVPSQARLQLAPFMNFARPTVTSREVV